MIPYVNIDNREKMKQILAFGILLLAFSAHAEDDQVLIEAAKKTVVNKFKDPESAQFRNLSVRDQGKSRAVCGEVNAKNSYGGYVGFKKFYVLGDSPNAVIKSGDRIMDPIVDAVCKPAS